MSSIGVNPPKTPVTEGSGDKSPATLPNVCKMPGPPAPFVPTPLPNIGQSSDGLSDCTSTVKFEGKKVAIKGSYYMSKLSGDMASKGTGGGIISATTEGKTKFVAPGSMNVKAEGKNIQLLGDAMSNNGSNPDNSATVPGNIQGPIGVGGVATSENADNCNGAGTEGEKYKGGKHTKMARGGKSSGTESHHTPAHSRSASPQSRGQSPSVQMDVADHMQTLSWGSGNAAKAYRAMQRQLMSQGKKGFRAAMMLDIKNIRAKFGTKYDSAIRQMLAYANCNGLI
jgi:uncharacterized Zn-binding protein involved in type VI secretion